MSNSFNGRGNSFSSGGSSRSQSGSGSFSGSKRFSNSSRSSDGGSFSGSRSSSSSRSGGGFGGGRSSERSFDRSSGGSRFSNSSRSPFNRNSRRPRTARLNPAFYVNTQVESIEEKVFVPTHTFADFGLNEQVLTNVIKHKYIYPTPIQDEAIPALMSGRDVVGIANTGTGKTAAFLLPLINKVILDSKQGVLILAPTRELALQIFEEFKAFAENLPIGVALCIGGMNIGNQLRRLKDDPHFVIGTPGRLKDLIERGAFKPHLYTNIVLDEVDRMLDIGFRKDIQYLISQLPEQRHAAFFSATMNRETEDIMRQFLTEPIRITVKSQETSNHIHQDIVAIKKGESKAEVLYQLLVQAEYEKVIVFGSTKHGINKLEQILYERGIRVTSIHGNKNQNARQRSLQEFKVGKVQALLATDVVARGIDIDNVSHVINYDEPTSYEDYIHRIGRTGRAGKVGKALTFVM